MMLKILKRNALNMALLLILIALLIVLLNVFTNRALMTDGIDAYSTNESGQTYGSAVYASSWENEPDLILAEGENGVVGYVYKTDLDGPVADTIEEQLKIWDLNRRPRSIPVYESDGRTVIGEFIVGGGIVTEYRDVLDELIVSYDDARTIETINLDDTFLIITVVDSDGNLFREVTNQQGDVYYLSLNESEFNELREVAGSR